MNEETEERVDYVGEASAGIARRLAELEDAYQEYCRLMLAQRALRALRPDAPVRRRPGRPPAGATSLSAHVREALGVDGRMTRDELRSEVDRLLGGA